MGDSLKPKGGCSPQVHSVRCQSLAFKGFPESISPASLFKWNFFSLSFSFIVVQ